MFYRHRLTSLSYTILHNIHWLKLNEISRGTVRISIARSAENFTYCLLSKIYEMSLKAKFLVSLKPNQTAHFC